MEDLEHHQKREIPVDPALHAEEILNLKIVCFNLLFVISNLNDANLLLLDQCLSNRRRTYFHVRKNGNAINSVKINPLAMHRACDVIDR